MKIPFKTTWLEVTVISMRTVFFIVASNILVSCTKTDDYLRDMVTKHSDFIDPSSAMFRNITYGEGKFGLSDLYCGEINAKNQMGGYVGWQPFQVSVYKRDGEVYVILPKIIEIPDRAPAELRDKIENFNMKTVESYKSECEKTQPAQSWLPFWKVF